MGVKRLKIEVSRVSLLIFCSDWMVSLSKAENNTGGKMYVSSLFWPYSVILTQLSSEFTVLTLPRSILLTKEKTTNPKNILSGAIISFLISNFLGQNGKLNTRWTRIPLTSNYCNHCYQVHKRNLQSVFTLSELKKTVNTSKKKKFKNNSKICFCVCKLVRQRLQKKKKKEKEKNTWLDYIVLVIVQFHPWFKVFV